MVFVWENTLINHCGETEILRQGKADSIPRKMRLPRQHHHPSTRQNDKMKKTILKVGEDAEQLKFSHIASGSVN